MLNYDGYFLIDNVKIYYLITDDKNAPIYAKKGDEKITRYFNFFDENHKAIEVIAVYDTTEMLQNITPEYAKNKYMLLKK